jgi:nitrate reductase NapAB chaperone NapD
MQDIRKIKLEQQLPQVLVEELEKYFKELVENLTGKKNWNIYSIEHDGSIVVLENTDNPHDLDEIGFSKAHGGIFSSYPEFANTIELEGESYYKIIIVCNNSYALVVYSKVGQFGEEFEHWIQEYIED